MKTMLLLLPFLAFSQTPPAAPAPPPKAAPKVAPRTQPAPRAAQPQPAPRTVQQAQPAPRAAQPQAQPRYTAPAAQPRYTPPAAQPRYTAPRAIPPVNVMPRTRNGAPLTRDIVLARPHAIFSSTVQPRAYAPGFVLRVNTEPPPFRLSEWTEPPRPGLVFIPGYWFWADGDYMWIDPAWAAPPVDGAHWVAPYWELQDDGTWGLVEGYWMDPNAN